MPFCIYCGSKNDDAANFCSNCGKGINSTDKGSRRKTVYDGELHKCPNCGELLNSFTTNCPVCGYELRGTGSSSSVSEFSRKLEEIEQQRKVKNESLFGKLGISERVNVSETDKKKISLISGFVIPNTKEDIFEFMILASSNIKPRMYNMSETERALSDAWKAKFEQAYQKAEINFGHSTEFKMFKNIYESKKKELKKGKRSFFILILVMILIFFLITVFPILITDSKRNNTINDETERLNKIVQEVYDCIEKENYTLARAKVSTIIFSDTSYNMKPLAEKWENTREELLNIIEQSEKGNKAPNESVTENCTSAPTEPKIEADETSTVKVTDNEFSFTYPKNSFYKGFKKGLNSNKDSISKNIEKFKENLLN